MSCLYPHTCARVHCTVLRICQCHFSARTKRRAIVRGCCGGCGGRRQRWVGLRGWHAMLVLWALVFVTRVLTFTLRDLAVGAAWCVCVAQNLKLLRHPSILRYQWVQEGGECTSVSTVQSHHAHRHCTMRCCFGGVGAIETCACVPLREPF